MNFDAPTLLQDLQHATPEQLDAAPFGIVRMDSAGVVAAYNRYESNLSGISPDSAFGRNFFTEIAPCTNNFMVAERYAAGGDLDELVDYVFTYRMAPTRVKLRLLRSAGVDAQYLCVLKV